VLEDDCNRLAAELEELQKEYSGLQLREMHLDEELRAEERARLGRDQQVMELRKRQTESFLELEDSKLKMMEFRELNESLQKKLSR
jgi:hypothetical protein